MATGSRPTGTEAASDTVSSARRNAENFQTVRGRIGSEQQLAVGRQNQRTDLSGFKKCVVAKPCFLLGCSQRD